MAGWCVVTIGPEGFCQAVACPDGHRQAVRLAQVRHETMPPAAWTHLVRPMFTLGEFDQRDSASDKVFRHATEDEGELR